MQSNWDLITACHQMTFIDAWRWLIKHETAKYAGGMGAGHAGSIVELLQQLIASLQSVILQYLSPGCSK